MIEQNDEWLVGRRHLSLDSLAPLREELREQETKKEVLELTAASPADERDELHHVLGLAFTTPP